MVGKSRITKLDMQPNKTPDSSDYRVKFYARYVSAFKGETGQIRDFAFSDSKLIPMLKPWTANLPRESRCLDLGCGHGNILHALRTLGFQRLEGVDLSAEQVEIARKEFPQVEQMSLTEKLQSAPLAAYDLIILFDVIEHLTKSEILDLFEMLVSHLAPNGIVIVHCPNGDSPFVGPVRYGDFTHETVLTSSSARNLCALFKLVNFEAKESYNTSNSIRGIVRQWGWVALRTAIRLCHLIETGSAGSGIVSRNFAFKAQRELA
jgi:2-polyprenyl-3-methyl-5-hydroxy-6-metoxy-1,4-benzoquinol methylase